MAAGTGALLVLIGGGAAGVTALNRDDAQPVGSVDQALNDPGAATLAQDPEIVSREAAAAEQMPRRHTGAPAVTVPPLRQAAGGAGAGVAGADAETSAELSRARAEDPADRTGPRTSRPDTGEPPTAKQHPADRGSGRKADERTGAKAVTKTGNHDVRPVITTRTDVVTRVVPYKTRVVRDPSLDRGLRQVRTPGANGAETVRYLVTFTDGRQTGKRVLDTTVTRKPQQRVIAVGAQSPAPAEECDLDMRICLPMGRGAICAGTPSATAMPSMPVEVPESEDLGLIGDVRLEPATLC
ncbi:G5 domain-containing protein [Actinoplanes sp. NPDC051851]|uniref:G5 domain-containing protein n=1 Tax=Actinoplanes sp. NPDC051851 TaxID=3154753 RepID=UPI0034355512